MGGDHDPVDFVQAIAHLRMQGNGRFTSRLRMELGRETDFEQDVFHHITAVAAGKTERPLVFGF
ncbi:hypothetical protein D3C87_1633700 [compost metagenome]